MLAVGQLPRLRRPSQTTIPVTVALRLPALAAQLALANSVAKIDLLRDGAEQSATPIPAASPREQPHERLPAAARADPGSLIVEEAIEPPSALPRRGCGDGGRERRRCSHELRRPLAESHAAEAVLLSAALPGLQPPQVARLRAARPAPRRDRHLALSDAGELLRPRARARSST